MNVVQRLLEGRFSVWKCKKERRLEKRAKAKEKRIKEWVNIVYIHQFYYVVWCIYIVRVNIIHVHCTCTVHVHVLSTISVLQTASTLLFANALGRG